MIENPRPIVGLPPNAQLATSPSSFMPSRQPPPRPLGLGNHFAPGPGGHLKATRHYIEVEIVISDQRRTAVCEPDGLAAGTNDGWWSIMAQHLAGEIVIANEGAYPIIVR